MNKFKILFLIALFSNSIKAQNKNQVDTLTCPISQNELLLSGKFFASSRPILLRVFNENYEYSVVQFGKRKNKIFLYFKIFTDNVCVKQKQPLELNFKDGERYILKNSLKVNCNGTAALELTRRDVKKLMGNNINTIKFYTLKKDYEFSPNAVDNQNIKFYLYCLKKYKVRRSK